MREWERERESQTGNSNCVQKMKVKFRGKNSAKVGERERKRIRTRKCVKAFTSFVSENSGEEDKIGGGRENCLNFKMPVMKMYPRQGGKKY